MIGREPDRVPESERACNNARARLCEIRGRGLARLSSPLSPLLPGFAIEEKKGRATKYRSRSLSAATSADFRASSSPCLDTSCRSRGETSDSSRNAATMKKERARSRAVLRAASAPSLTTRRKCALIAFGNAILGVPFVVKQRAMTTTTTTMMTTTTAATTTVSLFAVSVVILQVFVRYEQAGVSS